MSAERHPAREPIALVGIGCRFPNGITSPAEFWRYLCDGAVAVRDVPSDRWNAERHVASDTSRPGKSYVKRGSFLDQPLDGFDAPFFGMSPREAARLDPQQRLLLEVTWEAFEDAGIPLGRLRGSDTGVFVGGFLIDHAHTMVGGANRRLIDVHTASGSCLTMLAARLSHAFDLRGPALSIDTACSSSLVATHYACLSLEAGECQFAIVGGVNVMLSPDFFVTLCKAGMLAPDGISKAFDARANGYGRGEGAAVVVLCPLSVAEKAGLEVYALIRGSAVNQDGYTPDGISVPSPTGKRHVMLRALARAGVRPSEVGYVEAHGTGTPAGDPIEVRSIGAILGSPLQRDVPVWLGSVKANIGHLEGAAGIAGLIKATLCVFHGQIPPQPQLLDVNKALGLDQLPLAIPRRLEQWLPASRTRIACVNAFGFGGTNAHAVLSQVSHQPAVAHDETTDEERSYLCPISAKTEPALRAFAAELSAQLKSATNAPHLSDVAHALSSRRDLHDARAALVADSIGEVVEKLDRLSSGEPVTEPLSAGRLPRRPRLVFVYTGMGPQWPGMGRELMRREPVFARAIERLDEQFRLNTGFSPLACWLTDGPTNRMSETLVAQTTNVMLQVALTDLWRSWGVRPDSVVGHSVGEIAAAYACGALSMADTVRVVYHRSHALAQVAGQGGMLAVAASADEVAEWLVGFEGVSIAAINASEQTTLAGSTAPLAVFAAWLEQRGVEFTPLRVEIPYHSGVLDPLRDGVLAALAEIRPHRTDISFYSTVSGALLEAPQLDAAYWWQNLRRPVQFALAAESLIDSDHRLFVQVGPHPVLSSALRSAAAAVNTDITVTCSLQRDAAEQRTMLLAASVLHAAGIELEWPRLTPYTGRAVRLPRYPWQRQSLWSESPISLAERCGPLGRPFLGPRLGAPRPTWEVDLDVEDCAFLSDHRVGGAPVFPAAGYVEAFLSAAEEIQGKSTPLCLREICFDRLLPLDQVNSRSLRLEYDANTLELTASAPTDANRLAWSRHATACIDQVPASLEWPSPSLQVDDPPTSVSHADDFYETLRERGYDYGSAFRAIQHLYLAEDGVHAQIVASDLVAAQISKHCFHPALLDACLHAMLALIPVDPIVPDRRTFLPIAIERLYWLRSPSAVLECHAWIEPHDDDEFRGALVVHDDKGRPVLAAHGVRARAMPLDHSDDSTTVEALTFDWEAWTPSPRRVASDDRTWLILDQGDSWSTSLASALLATGRPTVRCSVAEPWQDDEDGWVAQLTQCDVVGKRLAGVVVNTVSHDTEMMFEVDALGDRASRAVAQVNALYRAIARESSGFGTPRVHILTRASVSVDDDDDVLDPMGAALWGLGRVAYHELGELHTTLIDLPAGSNHESAIAVASVLGSDTEEEELALRSAGWFVHRVDHVDLEQIAPSWRPAVADSDSNWGWIVGSDGEALRAEFIPRPSAAGDERLIRLEAALTQPVTRDRPSRPGNPVLAFLGVGREIEPPHFPVLVRGPFSAQAQVAARAHLIAALPPHLGLVEAASALPWLRASALWQRLIPLREGMSIWMVQPESSFAQTILRAAARLGARVLVFGPKTLNCGHTVCDPEIAGVFARQSPPEVLVLCGSEDGVEWEQYLPADGWWVDARDDAPQLTRRRQDAGRHHRRLRFGPTALADWPAATLVEFVSAAGALATSSTIDEELEDARVLRFDLPPEPCLTRNRPSVRGDATFVITGGLGGFGLATAEWLIARGARHIALLGRHGADDLARQRAVASLRQHGTTVDVLTCDVRTLSDLQGSLDWLRTHRPPIRGVVHAANDPFVAGERGLMQQVESDLLTSLMAAKLQGAWNLHRATRHDPIELFLLYSSMAAMFGITGAAPYVAANGFLDGLAGYRRGRGLPGLSIQWGAVSDVGVLLRHPELAEYNDSLGLLPRPVRRLLQALDQAILGGETVIALTRIDWTAFAGAHPASASSPRCSRLPAAAIALERRFTIRATIAALRSMPISERRQFVQQHTREAIAQLTDSDLESIADNLPLDQLGFDSLTTVELQLELQRRFGVRIPLVGLLRGATVETLAEALGEHLTAPTHTPAPRRV